MRSVLAFALLAVVACGATPAPAAGTPTPSLGAPGTQPQLKFAVMDAAGTPVYCDPDFYPVARDGGEQANAIKVYPQIKADAQTYAAIVAHEHLPPGDLTDAQKLVLYRAWKLLRALVLTPSSGRYTFDYTVASGDAFQQVSGMVSASGSVSVTSRQPGHRPMCPICLAASTLIATPSGEVRVTDVHLGTVVWSQAADGARVAERVVAVGSMAVPPEHMMVHLTLADGRELLASPGHRTAGGRPLGLLRAGDALDGSKIVGWELVPYAGGRTYDLLPAGATGHYWANGVELSSTLEGSR